MERRDRSRYMPGERSVFEPRPYISVTEDLPSWCMGGFKG